jgi:polyisoprenoid-binding protein YceI
MRKFFWAMAAFTALTLNSQAAEYKLNGENTTVKFVGTKTDGKHEGGFKTVTGTLTNADGKMAISVDIDMDSTWSDDDKLTGHLKSPDFFGVKTNPKSKFVSKSIEKKGDAYTVTGDLTLCGVTKAVSFPATIKSEAGVQLASDFKINRTDFGMNYGKGKINEEVAISIKVDAK